MKLYQQINHPQNYSVNTMQYTLEYLTGKIIHNNNR